MALQEQAIFAPDSPFSYYMEWALADISRARLQQHIRSLLTALELSSPVHALVAFGERTWNLLSDHQTIDGLQSFRSTGMSSSRFAPSTQRDVMIWLHGARHDENFRAALAINAILKGDAELRLELTGFRNFDNRDLNGFIVGAANPPVEDIAEIALIASPASGAGGSFVITQKWQYDLDAFKRLPIAEQERVMGRHKVDGRELDSGAMPLDAHAMRAERDRNGSLKIYHRSVPYGTVDESGLYFMAFSAQQSRFNVLLDRMYGQGAGQGAGREPSDRFLDYSKPTTGSFWFAPSLAHLLQVVD